MKGHPKQALVHDIVEPNELWHRWLAHVHFRALPLASKDVEGLLVLHTEYPRTRLLKESSPARNQKSAISEYLVVQCTYTFQKRRGLN